MKDTKQPWEDRADALVENLKLFSGGGTCPVCGVNPKYFKDFVKNLLTKERQDLKEQVLEAVMSIPYVMRKDLPNKESHNAYTRYLRRQLPKRIEAVFEK